MLVAPDTSPRGHDVPGEADSWDFGVGAGFYLDATQDALVRPLAHGELRRRRAARPDRRQLPRRPGAPGDLRPLHGRPRRPHPGPAPPRPLALGLGLRPDLRPHPLPLGPEGVHRLSRRRPHAWAEHDACELLRSRGPLPFELLVDQGLADKFLAEQLKPELLEAAAAATGQRLTLRRHAGYDHSYWFIQTFMADHIAHHARALGAGR